MNEKVIEELYLSHSNSVDLDLPIVQTIGNDYEKKLKKTLPQKIPAFGILMAILSVTFFSLSSVIVKVLTELHSIEILIFRYPFFGVSGHRIDLLLRSIFGTISVTCIYMAYRLIPLADASTIHFSSPVFVTILAYFILKEPLTLLQIATGIVTLTGVVIIAKPEFIFSPDSKIVSGNRLEGVVLAVLSALGAALVLIWLRKLKTTPVAVVIMWYSFINIVISLITLFIMDSFVWPIGWRVWTLLSAIGIFSICDQYFMTLALHYESAGPVSVTRTFNIVLAFLWDIFLFSQTFDWTSVVGASLVSVCIIILAIFKWKEENPELFKNLRQKCCSYEKIDEKEYLRKYSEPYYDSIDSRFVPIEDQRNGRLILEDRKI